MFDILIKNGTIVDGTGTSRFVGDVAVKDGKISEIGTNILGNAKEIVDATGLIVAPGFVDGHTHSDRSALKGSNSYNFLEQGVTTQIAGQCGSSPAPLGKGASVINDLSEEEKNELEAICKTPGSFMKHAETQKCGTNMAFYVGHCALRSHAMGYSDAKPNPEQMQDMKNNIIDAMEHGFLGYSSGLGYAPSVYADTDELIELAKVMAPYNGVYTSHIRSEGDTVAESVAEAIRVGEETGVPVVISHLKVCGKRNEGRSSELIKLIEEADKRGIKIYADQYPFTASSAPLSAQIPAKYLVGGIDEMLKRLENHDIRKQILHSIFNEPEEFESAIYNAGFEGVLIVASPKKPEYIGKTVTQIAEELGKEPIDAYCDLLLENKGSGQGIYFSQFEKDMLEIMAHPLITFGSDWSDYPDSRIDPERQAGGHPRGTASLVRRLELVRNHNLRTLEDSIRSVSSLVAEAVGIKNHGYIKKGLDANITILDYNKLKCNADFIHPFRRNEGILTVIVNGKIAVRDGKALGIRNGKILKRG